MAVVREMLRGSMWFGAQVIGPFLLTSNDERCRTKGAIPIKQFIVVVVVVVYNHPCVCESGPITTVGILSGTRHCPSPMVVQESFNDLYLCQYSLPARDDLCIFMY